MKQSILVFLFSVFFLPNITLGIDPELNLHIHKYPYDKPVNCLLKDKDGFLWLGTREGLIRYDGFDFEVIDDRKSAFFQLTHPEIYRLMEDSQQNLWIGTAKGFNIFQSSRDTIYQYFLPDEKFMQSIQSINQLNGKVWINQKSGPLYQVKWPSNPPFSLSPDSYRKMPLENPDDYNVIDIIQDQKSNLYLLNSNDEIIKYDTQLATLAKITLPVRGQSLCYDPVHDQLLVTSKNGIYGVSADLKEYALIQPIGSGKPNILKMMKINEENYLLYGNQRQLLMVYNVVTNKIQDWSDDLQKRLNSFQYSIREIIQVEDGHYLLATNLGLIGISFQPNTLDLLPKPPLVKKKELFSTRKIIELDKNRLLIGSYQGLFIYDQADQSYRQILYPESQNFNPLIYDMVRVGDSIMMATEGNGVLLFDIQKEKLSNLLPDSVYARSGKRTHSSKWGLSIFQDSQNTWWLGAYGGLFQLDLNSHQILPLIIDGKDVFDETWVLDITEDGTGNLWLATAKGLYWLNRDRDQLQKFLIDSTQPHGFTCLAIHQSWLWAGTLGQGMIRIDLSNHNYSIFNTSNGLADNFINSLVYSDAGNLWIGCQNGLSHFDLGTEVFSNYSPEDGLPSHLFNHKSFLMNSQGDVFLGGINGVVKLKQKPRDEPHHNSSIKVSKFVEHNGKYNQLREKRFDAHFDSAYSIAYNSRYFTIYFSQNSFEKLPPAFEYRLSSIHQEWQSLGENNYIQFAALPPGNYQLQVKNANDPAEILSIAIEVEKAYYFTWWAYSIYLLVLAGLISLGIRLYLKKIQATNHLKLEQISSAKLKEVDQLKSRFFTHFAHEIKTPLSLIKAPAQQLAKMHPDSYHQQLTNQINRNTDNIVQLLDQVYELNRLDSTIIYRLNFKSMDLVKFLQNIVSEYQHMAVLQCINFQWEFEKDYCLVQIDPKKFLYVINNLISNAFKFTPEGGQIKLRLKNDGENTVKIEVWDNGNGIAENELPMIFDRFWQSASNDLNQAGLGVGLSLVKELTEMHHGRVEVDSKPGKGTCFHLFLPVSQPGFTAESEVVEQIVTTTQPLYPETEQFNNSCVNHGTQKPKILIIEDHHELKQFLINYLATDYQVFHASDGLNGYTQALKVKPDLIISDLMMPKTDGLTLIEKLKNYPETHKIPLIILSAKNTPKNRIEGFAAGAEAYLSKPFQLDELKLTIQNLLKLKEASTEASHFSTSCEKVTESSLYKKMLHQVELHMDQSNYNVNQLVSDLGISRTQLYRQIKELTGKSPQMIIRSIKMQRAYLLLQQGLTIKEVSFQLGYGSPSQFAKIFKDYYNATPKTFQNKQRSI